jgi:outer membrane protein OmpA-like peptidoglycan-associated protein
MHTAHHLSLSPLESAILGALRAHGTGTAVELVGVMHPQLKPSLCQADEAREGLAVALATLKILTVLCASGYAQHDEAGRFNITLVGQARLEQSMTAGCSPRTRKPSGLMLGLVASTLALSACSTWFPFHTAESSGQQSYQAQPVPQMFELQQIRMANGAVGFRLCAAPDCEQPTPKVVAATSELALAPPTSPPEPPKAAAPVPVPTAANDASWRPSNAQQSMQKPAPAAHFRVYFRFAASDLGPEGMAAIKSALPELRTMARIEIFAGTDPTGTAEQNDKQIALRQAALKNLLVASGVRPEAIALVQDSPSLGLSIRGMQPRTTQHAEMRQGNLVAFK